MDKFKKVMGTLMKSKVIQIVLIFVLLVGVLIPAFVRHIYIEDGTYREEDWTSTPYAVSEYTGSATVGQNGIETTSTPEELWNKMDKAGGKVSDYLDSPEELKRLMNAELITQFPKIKNDDAENENQEEIKLDGIIQFQRRFDDGTTVMLQYKDKEVFDSYVESSSDEVFNYFTLDEQENAIIATKRTTEDKITTNDEEADISEVEENFAGYSAMDGYYYKAETVIETRNINYKNMVQKFSMPFDYLWAMLIIGNDKDFVFDLVKLVENSEIVVSILDNTVTTVTTNEYTYYKAGRTEIYAHVEPDNDFGVNGYPTRRWWDSQQHGQNERIYPALEYQIGAQFIMTHEITTYINTPTIDLTKANVWLVDYSKEYTIDDGEPTGTPENIVELEDTGFVEIEGSPITSDEDASLYEGGFARILQNECKEYIEQRMPNSSTNSSTNTISNSTSADNSESSNESEVVVRVKFVRKRYYINIFNRRRRNSSTTTRKTITAETPKSDLKIQRNTDKANFVKILSSYPDVKSNIVYNFREWLFEILESNESTANMVNLTKYFFYKLTGRNFGVDDYSFEEYEKEGFTQVTANGEISLTNTIFTKEVFIQALTAYSSKGASGNKDNFDAKILPKAGQIYDICVKIGFNPELAITLALKESGFNDHGTNNFWGLRTPNGEPLHSYASFEEALTDLGMVYAEYMPDGSYSEPINQRAAERQAANCNPNGYGVAGTLKGAISVYSDLCGDKNTKHREGDAGDGGNYYLKVIYGDEFPAKCGNVHRMGEDDYTIQEKADYTAWLYEKQIEYWNSIFGEYGTLMGGGLPGNFVRYKQSNTLWAQHTYINMNGIWGTISENGCGACALAMAVTGLTGQSITPDIIADVLNESLISTVDKCSFATRLIAMKYGLTYTYMQEQRTDKAAIDAALDSGKCLIFSINYNGIYTGDGHFIMVYKRDSAGYYVLESGSYYDENQPYAFNQVFTPGKQGPFAIGR